MPLFSLAYLLLALLSLSTFAQSCRPSVCAVGLNKDQTLDNHLRVVGRPISTQEHRLEINGYTASIPNDDKAVLKAIRRDPSVGFLVKIPQDYFRKFVQEIAAGPDEIDDEIYEAKARPNYQWGMLQRRDPEVIQSDYAGRRMPLEWEFQLEEGYSLDVFVNLITNFNPNSVSIRPLYIFGPDRYNNQYHLRFKSGEQERKSLPLIHDDYRVEAIWPDRCNGDVIRVWIRIDGEDVPNWEDGCVFGLGYRQWDKEPIVSIPKIPSTRTLDPRICSLRGSYSHIPTRAPIVYSWEAKFAKERQEWDEMLARELKDMKDRAKFVESHKLQELARETRERNLRKNQCYMKNGAKFMVGEVGNGRV